MKQSDIFSRTEGNAWFDRNKGDLNHLSKASASHDVSYALETLKPFEKDINSILEIGCSNGIKLEAICQNLNASGEGIDPSIAAIDAGNSRENLGNIRLHVGTGEKLSFESSRFDLVYFAFCLYLFDRETLIQSLAEADRVLRPGGFLVITDFDPGQTHKRPYSHFGGIYSYKQDYSLFYLQSGLYHLVGKKSFSHRKSHFDTDSAERVSTSVLYKEIDPYPTQT